MDELERTNREIEQPDFWDNIEYAQKVMKQKSAMEDTVNSYERLETGLRDIEEMIELCELEEDEDTADVIVDDFEQLKKDLEELRIATLLTGKYDHSNAILSIHAGAGGVEAMDWAEMLFRMYTRYCEKKGYKVRVIDYQDDTEAGIKSATIIAEGENAYGYLKNEKGTHRLVRISPFNAQGKRQTSFALVEVTPEIDDDVDIEINPEDPELTNERLGLVTAVKITLKNALELIGVSAPESM